MWFKNYPVTGIDWVEDTTTKSLQGKVPAYMLTKDIVNELHNCPLDKQNLNAEYVTERVVLNFEKGTAKKKIEQILTKFLEAKHEWTKDWTSEIGENCLSFKTNYTLYPEAFFI